MTIVYAGEHVDNHDEVDVPGRKLFGIPPDILNQGALFDMPATTPALLGR